MNHFLAIMGGGLRYLHNIASLLATDMLPQPQLLFCVDKNITLNNSPTHKPSTTHNQPTYSPHPPPSTPPTTHPQLLHQPLTPPTTHPPSYLCTEMVAYEQLLTSTKHYNIKNNDHIFNKNNNRNTE